MKQYHFTPLKVSIYPTWQEMGRAAAVHTKQLIVKLLEDKPFLCMIFAAAPSQNEFLQALSADSDIPFERIHALHMDEYIGLPDSAPQRFGNFLKERLFTRCQFASVEYLNGNAPDTDIECARYTQLLVQRPPDIVCGGIGENGHIAFNDPDAANFADPVAVKRVLLDEACRRQQVNDGCFAQLQDVPLQALTLTIPALMRSTHKVFVVPSTAKAQAVRTMLCEPVSEKCPASVLRTAPNSALFLDANSAAMTDFDRLSIDLHERGSA